MNKKIIHTRKRYIALTIIFILLGLVLVFLPERDNTKKLAPEKLLISLNDNSRLVKTDEIADRLINNDPSFVLIDVRSEEEFEKGSLPGALNIPLTEILSEESMNIFQRKAYDKIIFSNNDVLADQAWIVLAGKLVERTFILKGGLNEWGRTIVNPVKPDDSAPVEAFELYNTRKAACRYFAGQSKPFEYIEVEVKPSRRKISATQKKQPTAPVLPPPPEEEEEEEEGC